MKLLSRHWIITNAEGHRDEVRCVCWLNAMLCISPQSAAA